MTMKWVTLPAMAALAAAMALPAARAQHHGMAEAKPQEPYTPRLGDIMTMLQIRHSKLWFAAAANNWELADHELDEMKEGFEDVEKFFPTVHEVSVASVIGALNEREIAALGDAIGARDRVKFAAAFDKLTAACNACHQVTKHAFIVIQQPISPPFNNQSFAPGPQLPSAAGGHPH
jgi:hypothetical protein